MAERLLLTLLLTAVSLAVFWALRAWHVGVLNRRPLTAVAMPTLLYFRSDSCLACPTQGRYLEQVAQSWNGRLAIQPIDTDQQPETAAQYRVMSLPTTILLDEQGQVKQINYGVTNAHKLSQQIEKVVNH